MQLPCRAAAGYAYGGEPAIQLLSGGQGPQGKKRRTESLFSWKDHVSRLTEREFKLRYRLDFVMLSVEV